MPENQYRPWKKLGITEAEYFQERYLEERRRADRLEIELAQCPQCVVVDVFKNIERKRSLSEIANGRPPGCTDPMVEVSAGYRLEVTLPASAHSIARRMIFEGPRMAECNPGV